MAYLGGMKLTLGYGTTSTANTLLANIVSFSGVSKEAEVIQMSNQTYGKLDSVMEVFVGEYLPSTVQLELVYDGVQQVTIEQQFNKKQYYRITYADNSYHVLYGIMNAVGVAAPMKDRMTSTVTITYHYNATSVAIGIG